MADIKIKKEHRIFDGFLKIDEASVEHNYDDGTKGEYFRSKLVVPNVVSILIYNKQTDCVVLTEQFRYPVAKTDKSREIECVAGRIDDKETARMAAIREIEEEVGYVINPDKLIALGVSYVSPGYSSEKVHQFAVVVTNKDKKSKGGGLASENEDIKIINMPYIQFRSLCENGSMPDMKTKLAYYSASYEGVFKTKRIIPKVPKQDRAQLNEGADENQLKIFKDE